MKLGFEINLEQSQKLVMTPELQQAITILQLSSQELTEYIEKQLMENPVLEVKEDSHDERQIENSKIDWQEYFRQDRGYVGSPSETKEDTDYNNFLPKTYTLQEHLLLQLGIMSKSDHHKKIGKFLIGNIDEGGYLRISLEEIERYFKVERVLVEDTLNIIQSMDPVGVGARSLEECLLIQVKNKEIDDENIEYIISNCLDDLAEGKFNKVAKEVNISIKKLQDIMDFIKTLDPKPGRWFASGESIRYIVPDVTVEKIEGQYIVLVNDVAAPRIGINPLYRALMKKNSICDNDTKKYLEERLNAASWVVKSIEQRRLTMYKVVSCIVKLQKEFFDKGCKYLKPLNLKQVASEVNLHESTVSRATSGKYVQTPQGVFPLKFFFTSGINKANGSSTSSHSIKKLIQELINKEDSKNPFSDQALTDILNERGIQISRRTVAKYRNELQILSASRRKRY